ncbi:hypothetical protein [Streptomyces zingiberis]|uniref:Aldose 1-epimerase n=1 Tax=Streptomyces zingiberis TaxID=2053010 RepID=A0ABX1BW15_9ACTN|nr:hypothetical protein [Streptomyces zingiberis]NJQ01268.1 hypothetical protein [Streptomyces zingiberis]
MPIHRHGVDGERSLTLDAGGLAADATRTAYGHEPNGYVRDGPTRFAWPGVAERLVFDSEAGMFS